MYEEDNDTGVNYPTFKSGPYNIDPQTGMFEPNRGFKLRPVDPDSNLQNMVRALMRGYVRKQQNPQGGGYLPYTSVAPGGMTDQFRVLNRYNTFGVPYTGIPYGQQQENYDDPFSNKSY